MGRIQRNIAQAQAVKLKYDDTQTPKALTHGQFETLLASVPKVNGRTSDDQRRKLRGLLLLMRWSGLATRNAVSIERARFDPTPHCFCTVRRVRNRCTPRCGTKSWMKFLHWQIQTDHTVCGIGAQDARGLDPLVKGWGDLFRKLGLLADSARRSRPALTLHQPQHAPYVRFLGAERWTSDRRYRGLDR